MDCLFDRWVREMFMREAHFDTAHVVEPLHLIGAEMCIQRAQVIFQLLAPKRTDVTVGLERSQASAT
jgi:hypothetical protein